MLGESAMSLVKEAARNKGSLNPFNEDLVRQTIEETRRMWEQNRCVLTYVMSTLHWPFNLNQPQ